MILIRTDSVAPPYGVQVDSMFMENLNELEALFQLVS